MDRHVTHDAGEPRFFLIIGRGGPLLTCHTWGPRAKSFLIGIMGVPRGGRRHCLHCLLIWLRRSIFSSSSGMCEEAYVHPSPKPPRLPLIIGHVLDSCVTVLQDFLHHHQIFLCVCLVTVTPSLPVRAAHPKIPLEPMGSLGPHGIPSAPFDISDDNVCGPYSGGSQKAWRNLLIQQNLQRSA